MRKLILLILILIPFILFASGKEELNVPEGMTVIQTQKYTFQVVEMGDPEGRTVILLHGFPETSAMWRELQVFLADNGYYTLAPDQRGYSPEARPQGRRHYQIDELVNDVIAMADSKGLDRFHLIGHDWGSAVGWAIVDQYPERIISWTAMSVPHPEAFSTAIEADPLQYKASSYMRLFQWPWIPELYLKGGDYKNLRGIWDQGSPELIESYLSVFRQPGALTGALNWYRANYKSLTEGKWSFGKIDSPSLFIWGSGDSAILRSGAELNSSYHTGPYSELFLEAGHWLIQERFDQVSRAIIEHLDQYK